MNLVERVAQRAADQQAAQPAVAMGGKDLHDLWKKQEPHFRQTLHQQSKHEWHLKEIKGPTEHGEVTIVWESPGQGSLALYGTSMSEKQNDVRLFYSDPEGMPEQPKVMRVPNDKLGDPSIVGKLLAQYKGKTEWTKVKPKSAASYAVAARYLEQRLADQGKAAPKKVDDLFKEVKDGNPGYSEEQAWATAWSIYCKHVDPNGDHCHKSPGGYLKEANEAAKVRAYLAKSIKHMKDITGPKWEKFAKDNPGLAAASIHMAAQDAIRAMEEADKLLATTKEAADEAEGSIERPTPMAGQQQTATEETAPTPEESHWNHWEKHGEWNLNLYKQGSRWGWFLKNPKGGGGGSRESSMAAAIGKAMAGTGWGSPHINPEGKTKVWVTVLKWDPSKGEGDWVPAKSEWKDVPKEFIKPPKPSTPEEHWDRATR